MMKIRTDFLEQLEKELAALQVKVSRAHSKEELLGILNSLLTDSPTPTIALENRSLIQALNLEKELQKENRKILGFDPQSKKDHLREKDWEAVRNIDIGIGGADYALADTGTMVLFSSKSGGRWVSLAPTIHICLLPQDRILPSLDDLFSVLPLSGNGAIPMSAITFITGPSRTADIELTLVMGAHGPKELHVVILLFPLV
jgi:L-lactate dehydrogenase complex protein LldG